MTTPSAQPDYQGVRLKLRRARSHLNALGREGRKLSQPAMPLYVDRRGYAAAKFEGKLPPLRFGVYAGDFAHNARSALDHLVWQLVIANSVRPARHKVFPVYATLPEWRNSIEARDPEHGPSPLEGVSADAWQAIRACQPFATTTQRRDAVRSALFQLHRLSIIDKHRTVHPAHVRATDDVVGYFQAAHPGITVEDHWFIRPGQRLLPGEKIVRLRFLDAEGNPVTSEVIGGFQVLGTIAFELGESDGGTVSFERLREILAEVTDIIENLIAAVG